MNWNIFKIKIDRLSAWVLAIGMVLYFISGYGMTKGIFDYSFATKIHLDYLTLIILIAFTVHTSYSIALAFKRWGWWNWFTQVILIIFYIAFLSFFIYVDRFYVRDQGTPKSTTTQTTETATPTTTSAPTTSTDTSASTSSTTSTSPKNFTTAELAIYNGKSGQPSYVAVDGTVYDMSSIFINGVHKGYYAGQDLSQAFAQYHDTNLLDGLPIKGVLK
jgi:predicted heme/steroid binding protein